MDPRCRIELLGPLRLVRVEKTQTRFGSQKAASLLAYLALRPGPHSREQIVDLFWPERDLSGGRNNLSTALSGLRRQLEPEGTAKGAVLVTTHSQIGLEPAAVTTDIADFERLLRDAEKADCPTLRADLLERALALYRTPFQPGNYQDWAVREAERLEVCRVSALDILGDDLEAAGRYAEAASIALQRLSIDPYVETQQISLIRRHVRAGQLAAARETARNFIQTFRAEFGTGPDAATLQAIDAIFAEQTSFVPSAAPPSLPPVEATGTKLETIAPNTGPALPFWLSRFFGREPELTRLAALLLPEAASPAASDLSRPPARLVTLAGTGGAGKTRLAAEFSRLAIDRFRHWCAFVPLADLTEPDQISSRIAQTLHLVPSLNIAPLEQIAAFFADHSATGASPALLILDNLEHLLGPGRNGEEESGPSAAETVRALLGAAPGLALLCTSRRPLNIGGEELLLLGPLPVPEADDPATNLAKLAEIPSVRLYIDRAQIVRPDFGLTPVNAPSIAALCRALEGSPLALELAASWVRLMPPRKMWERLSQGLEVPEGRREDLPARHRSLSAALDWSWRLLTPAQCRLLARLSVFRGGWTLEAAEAACEEPEALTLLADLEEASLVVAREDDQENMRYRLLETVRQYAAQKLAEEPEAAVDARERHLQWCLDLALKADAELRSPKQGLWLSRLGTEHDNLRAALDWAAHEAVLVSEPGQSRESASLVPASLLLSGLLEMFWRIRGHLQEGRTYIGAALAWPDAQAGTKTRASTLQSAAMLATEQGDLTAARSLHEEALVIYRTLGDPFAMLPSLNNLAIAVYDQGDSVAARTLWEEALAIARHSDTPAAAASPLANLGELAFEEGKSAEALPLLEEALALHRSTGSKYNIAYLLKVLATVTHQRGDLAAARRFLAESLPIQHDLGHRAGIAQTLEAAASLALSADQPAHCASLCGTAMSLRKEIAVPLPANERSRHDADIVSARAVLGDKAFQAAFILGGEMTWEQAVKYALVDGL